MIIECQCPVCKVPILNVSASLRVGERHDLYCSECDLKTVALIVQANEVPKAQVKDVKMTRYHTTAQINLVDVNGRKIAIINPREIVNVLGAVDYDGFINVRYINSMGKVYEGYVEFVFLEEFVSNDGIIKIGSPTIYQGDAAQYLIYNGVKQYNLCGEFSVLYCAGWHTETIETWLEEWKVKSLPVWTTVFGNKYSRPTDIPQLENMFQTFDGYPEKFERLTSALFLPERNRPHTTPGRVKELLEDNLAIVGCKISSYTGRLQASGTPHWVVLESVSRYQFGGLVTLYNPFSNSLEEYSWEELMISIKTPYGIRVARR